MRNHRWNGLLTVVGAVAVVAALSLLTVTALSAVGDDDEDVLEAADSTTTTTDTTTTTARPRLTTTTTAVVPAPTTTPPEVLGDVTVREPGSTPSTGATTPPPTTAAPTTTTTTTARVCRNSTDPACGPLVWDPAPGSYEVEVYPLEVPTRATVGTPVHLAVYYIEASGPDAHGTCFTWETTDPQDPYVAGCATVSDASCPRYGPHAPPAPSRAGLEYAKDITFTTPGEHVVTLTITTAGQLADGCPSPYRQTWSGSFPITVEAAPPT